MPNSKRKPPRGKAVLDEMNEKLREQCTQVAQLLTTGAVEAAKARHKIGAIINCIDDDGKRYGSGAVRKVAAAVGRDVDSLYDYARVAKTWPTGEFSKIAARKNGGGVPLTFSHFVQLAHVGNSRTRESLMERAYGESLSVRALERLVDEHLDRAPSEEDVSARLKTIAVVADRVLARASSWASSLARIKTEAATPELAALIDNAAGRQRAVGEAYLQNAAALDEQHQRVVKKLGIPGEKAGSK